MHAPEDYACPICLGVQGIENDQTLLRQSDIVYKDDLVTAFINSFFIKGNEGHVIVVPNEHFENIYDISLNSIQRIHAISRDIAKAMKKSYTCDGITIQQNNEPAGGQHAFHYHLHVFPRYKNDDFYKNILNKISTTSEERKQYSDKVKSVLEQFP